MTRVRRSGAFPRASLFCVTAEVLEGEGPTDERLFPEGVVIGVGQVAVELRESAASVVEAIEQKPPEKDARDQLLRRAGKERSSSV